jgi:hypothetical protein
MRPNYLDQDIPNLPPSPFIHEKIKIKKNKKIKKVKSKIVRTEHLAYHHNLKSSDNGSKKQPP